MEFKNFGQAVAKQFAEMSKGLLFRVSLGKDDKGNDITKDKMWEAYLAAYPEGSNPIYKVRTEHDCNCCKQFIRAVGNVVAVKDNKLVSIWDVVIKNEPEYQVVANAMAALIESAKISDRFLHSEASAGSKRTFHQLISGNQFSWDHFHVTIPSQFVVFGKDIPTRLNDYRGDHDVLLRSINELSDEAVEIASDLIAQNSLYRGKEFKGVLDEFKKLKQKAGKLSAAELDNFVWAGGISGAVARIRNTAFGTLLIDLSTDMDLESAVRRYEAVMAPANYRRPTSLVTKKMVEDARKKIEELGLTSALERRYAKMEDVKITDLLFANRSTKNVLAGDVFDSIATKPVSKKKFDGVEEIGIEKFIADILPKAQKIEVMVENRHKGNFVSLVAPVDPTAGQLFKWDNGFSWSYNGDYADSAIKEKVKAAGGNVTGELCCRLAWHNHDDLDFHMTEPSGREVYFGNKRSSATGGELDVDMNMGYGTTREPVENIFYPSIARMKDGEYTLYVKQFAARESSDVGFEVEIDLLGEVFHFAHPKRMSSGDTVNVASFTVKNGKITLNTKLSSELRSEDFWGIKTNEFVEVKAILPSPNAWGDKVIGNKHYFFMLNGCENEGVARGFYNEFLRSDLDKNRKVFEMVGAKMKTDSTKDQLSGVGFSDTKRDSILVKVSGAFERVIKVVI